MKLAIVILNWNGQKLLAKFLPNIVANSSNTPIYVVDNNSTDNSVQWLKNNYNFIPIIQHPKNLGYAKGYNWALKHINADIICLLNSDVKVSPEWLHPIIEHFKNQPNTAIVQPKILSYKSPEKFEYAGAAGGYIDQYGYAFCRGRVMNQLEIDQNQYPTQNVFWASGACMFVRKSVFDELNGFDEDFFAHYEEIDLCWRAQNHQYQVACVTESIVYHVGGATLKNTNPFKTYLNFRNSLFTLTKNLPSKKLFPIIFHRLVLDGIAGIYFLAQGKLNHFFSILKAHGSFYLNLKSMLQKRSKTPIENYYQTPHLIKSYYLKKQHKASDLL